MAIFDANAYLNNEAAPQAKPTQGATGSFDANSFLGNEGSLGEAPGIDQRLSDYDKLQAQHGGAGQQALTVLEGLGKGFAGPIATGAEALLTKAGVPGLTPEEQEGRAKANPILHPASEFAGFGIGAFLGTGEAGALAKIGEAASGLGKTSKIGQLAARVGAETASYQAAEEVSKAINQNPNQTLGTAAVKIGLSGILGAAGGASLGSVGPLWRSFTKSAAEDAGVGKAAAAQGEDHLTGSVLKPKEKASFLEGLTKQKANAKEIREAGQLIGEPVSASQTSASDYVQSMDSALSQSPTIAGVKRQQEIARGFDKIGKIVERSFGDADPELSPAMRGQTIKDQILQTTQDLYKPLKEKYAARGTLGEALELPVDARLKHVDELIKLSEKYSKARPEVEKIVSETADGLLRQETVADLDEYLKVLSDKARMLSSGPTPDHYAAGALRKAIESLDDFQIGQIAKQTSRGGSTEIAKQIVDDHKLLKKQYAQFKEVLGDLASDSKLGRGATTAGGIEDVLESIPNEKLVEKMFDPKNSAGLSRLKEKFPGVFQSVIDGKKADLIAASKGDSKALLNSVFGTNRKGMPNLSPEIRNLMFTPEEQQFLKASNTWIESLPKNVGPSGTPKGSAFMAALTQHPLQTIFTNTKDIGIKTLLKFASPGEIEANKVSTDYIQNALKGEKLLDRATKALFQTGDVIPSHLLPNEKSRERLKERLSQINENPDSALSVGGGISHHLPGHGVAAGTLAASAVNYFNSIRPTESKALPLDPGSPKSKQKEYQYNRALDIAEQPLLVFHHAKKGTLQTQDIKTIQAIYPGLREQMVKKVADQLAQAEAGKRSIPYNQRRMLSMITGAPLNSSQTLAGANVIMQANSSQQASPENQAQGKQHKASGPELSQINKVNQLFLSGPQRRSVSRLK